MQRSHTRHIKPLYYPSRGNPFAARCTRNTLVSAKITSLPSPAKTTLAESVSWKNLPRRVPSSFHTCTNLSFNSVYHIELYLNTVTATYIDVAIRVNLYTVGIARVNITKYTTVLEDLGLGIDIKPVSVRITSRCIDRSCLTLSPARSG